MSFGFIFLYKYCLISIALVLFIGRVRFIRIIHTHIGFGPS